MNATGAALLAALLLVAACTPAPTPSPTPTPTICPVPEWSVREVEVEGRTVTVVVRLLIGLWPSVQLDGREPDRVEERARPPQGVAENAYIFLGVPPGTHTLRVTDGCNVTTREVAVG